MQLLFLFIFLDECSIFFFFFSSRRRHTRSTRDWSSDVCSSDLLLARPAASPYVPIDKPSGYLRLVRSVFADQTDDEGRTRTLAEQDLEFVLPRERSCN